MATELVRKPFGKEKLEDGVVEVKGQVLDYFVIFGVKFDGTNRLISGHPIRTTMNTPEVMQYLTNMALNMLKEEATAQASRLEEILHTQEIKELEEEKARTELKRVQKQIEERIEALRVDKENADAEELRQIRHQLDRIERVTKDIDRTTKKPDILMSETYVFDDVMVVQVGHTKESLVDYGTVNVQTGHVYVLGDIHELPEPLTIEGRKVQFAVLNPWDLTEVEAGGMIEVLNLTHDERMALFEWTERAGKFLSFLRENQRRKTIETKKKVFEEGTEELQTDIGESARTIRRLQKALINMGGPTSIMPVIISLLVSVGGFAGFGLIFGFILSAAFGPIISDNPIYNVTSREVIRIDHIQTPNPLATLLPAVMTFAFVFIGIMFAARRWGRKA